MSALFIIVAITSATECFSLLLLLGFDIHALKKRDRKDPVTFTDFITLLSILNPDGKIDTKLKNQNFE